MLFLCYEYFRKVICHVHLLVIKEKIVYPTDVPRLHGFCTFSVAHLKFVLPHLQVEQLPTLLHNHLEHVQSN